MDNLNSFGDLLLSIFEENYISERKKFQSNKADESGRVNTLSRASGIFLVTTCGWALRNKSPFFQASGQKTVMDRKRELNNQRNKSIHLHDQWRHSKTLSLMLLLLLLLLLQIGDIAAAA